MTTSRSSVTLGFVFVVATLVTAGCGNATTSTTSPGPASNATAAEVNSAGDIPDNQVYVPFAPTNGLFTVAVPEGWSRSDIGAATVFTDKSNSMRVDTIARSSAPTVDSAKADELPGVESSTVGYIPGSVSVVERSTGRAVLATYQAASAVDPVTGKTVTEAVERYEFWRDGHEVILTLAGPMGADNVDPWRTVTDSLRWLQ